VSPIEVRLRSEWVGNVGYRYDVLLGYEIIVRRSRDPEYDAARALHARGLRGRFRTIDFRTGSPRMILDIERAAKLRTVERDDAGLMAVPYRPMTEADKTRARLHRAHQGWLSIGRVATDTRQPVKRVGGEGGATQRGLLPATDDDGVLAAASAEYEDA
jgi:hypothetical protein